MFDLKPNLEPGNPDGHTVLRYLVEARQMPLEAAIECVYKAVAKYAQEFRSDQNKLLGSMVVTGVLGLPVFFPFGVPSLLLAGAVATSAFRWQELGAMRDRLKPEYIALKNSVLLEQFIKWLAIELRSRRSIAVESGIFQPDELTSKNLIAAYEHTIGAVENGEHLDNNASDPILALFVAKLRQHTNQVPEWVIQAFRQLEQAETQRAADLARTNQYMFGNLEERYPERFNQQQVGHPTRLGSVDVPAQPMEGEQRRGEFIGGVISQPELPPHPETKPPDKMTATTAAPVLANLLQMPRRERAIAVLNRLSSADGFDLSRCIADQITCICGNQRGGKGTLMAILAILSSAIDESTKVHYFTAGDDIYPFKCSRLVCRLTYPALDGEKADRKVALELYGYLKEMDNGTIGSYQNIILVIDEAVALSDYLTPEQKQWMIRFLLTRAKKKGAQIFIVLHGINLTSWVGSGNTSGFSSTFKTGATFIGCEATSKKIAPLRAISVATGRYFLADPDDFSKSLEAGHLGVVPGWLKTEINPATGQPDPARTLLKFFPELKSSGQLVTKIVEVADSHPEMDKQAWDRLILESTDDQINELIEQHRTKPENIKAQANDFLSTIDERIDYAVELITEYLQEKKLESDTARNIFNFKSKLKKVAKSLTEFNDLLEVAAEMKKISYLVEGKSNRVGLLNDS
jgi:hypothetical protein